MTVKRRKKKKYSLKKFICSVFSLTKMTLITLMFMLLVFDIHCMLTGSPFFDVKKVQIVGNRIVSESDILDHSGPLLFKNIFNVDPTLIKQSICTHPWIKDVSVRLLYPATIRIFVEERHPRVIVSTGKGLFLCDKTGAVIAQLGNAIPVDLPVVTGLCLNDIVPGAFVGGKDFEDILKVLTYIKNVDVLPSLHISQVHVEESGALDLYTCPLVFKIRLLRGVCNPPLFSHLKWVLQHFVTQGYMAGISYIDLRFANQVVVGFKPSFNS